METKPWRSFIPHFNRLYPCYGSQKFVNAIKVAVNVIIAIYCHIRPQLYLSLFLLLQFAYVVCELCS
jgi:hypothetical protein